MSRQIRTLFAALLVLTAVFVACKGEDDYAEPEAFSFVVYPGSRYMGQLTENFKGAHKILNPAQEPPPTAVYDTDAPLEQVAEYYAKQYGYKEVAANADAKAPAYYKTGDLAADAKAIEGMLKQMNLATDVTKASGTYKGAEIAPRPNRPRVTLSRPYFDFTTSQVVDRTLILMTR